VHSAGEGAAVAEDETTNEPEDLIDNLIYHLTPHRTRSYFRICIHENATCLSLQSVLYSRVIRILPLSLETTTEQKDPQLSMYLDACKLNETIPIDQLANSLNLSTINIGNRGIGPKGAKAFAEVLKSNRSITYLDVSGNAMGELGGVAFGEMLASNISLQTLILSNNLLSGAGGLAIAEGVEDNITLRSLSVQRNRLSDAEATGFAKALRSNRSLVTLDLAYNCIGDIGGTEVIQTCNFKVGIAI
jgi:Ran GTPase-activating protein (RanGAP) involved in mRNA processing and transport